MSLNSDSERGSVAVPRLAPSAAGYATWAPRMTVVLQQRGAEGIHLKKMDEQAWTRLSEQVAAWHDEDFDAALALATGTPTGSKDGAASSSSSAAGPSAGVKESRKLLIATVERSHKAFGVLYAALPDELCLQVAHLPQGWAYGLWAWLQAKYQGTEEDSVDALFSDWAALRQESDESFDQYRARVARVCWRGHARTVSVSIDAFSRAGFSTGYEPKGRWFEPAWGQGVSTLVTALAQR
jgi:hypothetical protein